MSKKPTKKIDLADLKKTKLMIGTPMIDGKCHGMYSRSMNNLYSAFTANGLSVTSFYLFSESLVQRARNYIVDGFLRSDATHLLFIDSDIVFDPKSVIEMMTIQLKDPDKFSVLVGNYPKKQIVWEKVAQAVVKGIAPTDLKNYTSDPVINLIPGTTEVALNQPFEVLEGGTGFMLISRQVFEEYEKAYPELKYRPDHRRSENFNGDREITAYFDCVIDPETKRYLSEDYFFCKNLRKMGKSIWLCPWIDLKHIGSYTYEGHIPTIAQTFGSI